MTTFRLARQTSRSSRFAQVTVEVVASSRSVVEVSASATGEHHREARLGAHWALRHLARTASVTVTHVAVTEVDTGVGDVYEATACAVWQALQAEHPAPQVGISDPELVASWLTAMCGRRLDAVMEARYWYRGRREPDAGSLLHVWLLFDHAVPIQLHGHGDQLILAKQDPYPPYDIGGHGQARVGPARSPDVLSSFAGSRLTDGAVVVGHDGDLICAALVLRFDDGDLIVGSLGDEWVLAAGSVPAPAARQWTVLPFVRGGPSSDVPP